MRSILIVIGSVFLLQSFQCRKETQDDCFKGKLESIPNCGAPVIKILEGDLSAIQHETNWVHPVTGVSYQNVFTVENFCDFAACNIAEGEEFYFTLKDTADRNDCYICTAIFPVPSKSNIIEVNPFWQHQ